MNKPKSIRGRPKAKVVFIEPERINEPEPEPEPVIEVEPEPFVNEIEPEPVIEVDFLAELNNKNYGKIQSENRPIYEEPDDEPEPDNIQYEIVEDQPTYKEVDEPPIDDEEPDQDAIDLINRLKKQRETEPKPKQSRSIKPDDEEEFFSKNGSEIMGCEKRLLLSKITQYKSLFKNELKTFKIKKNANEEELQLYIDEMSTIVSISSIDNFITESVLQCIGMIEGISAYSNKYNVKGMSKILKENPQFNSLCRILYIKYGVFTKTPPEAQMILLIATTAFVCNQTNKKEAQMFLNQPMKHTTI